MHRWLLPALFASSLFAQSSPTPNLFRVPGTVIAEGKNTTPDGRYRLKSYRVEEIRFGQPTAVTVGGRTLNVDRVFRVTITGEAFPVRSARATVWVDETRLLPAQENADLTEVSAITADAALLRNGARLRFSFENETPEAVRETLLLQARP